jgi:hypothetical protein
VCAAARVISYHKCVYFFFQMVYVFSFLAACQWPILVQSSAMKKKNVKEDPKMYEKTTLLNSHRFVG